MMSDKGHKEESYDDGYGDQCVDVRFRVPSNVDLATFFSAPVAILIVGGIGLGLMILATIILR
jgi:hypothetical protein